MNVKDDSFKKSTCTLVTRLNLCVEYLCVMSKKRKRSEAPSAEEKEEEDPLKDPVFDVDEDLEDWRYAIEEALGDAERAMNDVQWDDDTVSPQDILQQLKRVQKLIKKARKCVPTKSSSTE